jgi:hypothetical protein
VERGGFWPKETNRVFQEIMAKLMMVRGGDPSAVYNFWKAKITLSVLVTNMQQCLYKMGLAARKYTGKGDSVVEVAEGFALNAEEDEIILPKTYSD